MAINSKISTRKLVTLSKKLLKEVEDFRFEYRIKTEAEAIRCLIQKGLEAEVSREEGQERTPR